MHTLAAGIEAPLGGNVHFGSGKCEKCEGIKGPWEDRLSNESISDS